MVGDFYGEYVIEDLSFLEGYETVNVWTQDIVQEGVEDVINMEVEDMEVGEEEMVVEVPVPNDGEPIQEPTLSEEQLEELLEDISDDEFEVEEEEDEPDKPGGKC